MMRRSWEYYERICRYVCSSNGLPRYCCGIGRWILLRNDLKAIPQSGVSSGIPPNIDKPPLRVDHLTIDEIVDLIRDYDGGIYGQPNFASGDYYKEIPYYKQVLEDVGNNDFSSEVTKKVGEYAEYMKHNPESVGDLPPIVIIDGGFADGSHRISAIYLLNNLVDVDNPYWDDIELKVDFYEKS